MKIAEIFNKLSKDLPERLKTLVKKPKRNVIKLKQNVERLNQVFSSP